MTVLRLEDFDFTARGEAEPTYDDGYQQGFADATAKNDAEQSKLNDELLSQISDMAFGYTEAYSHIVGELVPFFDAITNGLFPQITDEVLRQWILSHFMTGAEIFASTPLSVKAHPNTAQTLRPLFETQPGLAFQINDDPAMRLNTVVWQQGSERRALDLENIFSAISDAVREFKDIPQKEQKNG